MANQLNWSPGKPGKGFLTQHGDIHTWPVDVMDEPGHQNYWDNSNAGRPSFLFQIAPDGFVNDGGISYHNSTGRDDDRVLSEIIASDPRLHTEGQDEPDWTLPEQMPGSNSDAHGPDYNFIMQSSEEADYAQMLLNWLNDLEGGVDTHVPLTPHHQGPEDFGYEGPQQPYNASPYWPPGHVPDWAEPASEGRRSSEAKPSEDPDAETTTGGWLRDQTERVIEREITPQEYDEQLDEHVAKSEEPKRGPWLKRLFRR